MRKTQSPDLFGKNSFDHTSADLLPILALRTQEALRIEKGIGRLSSERIHAIKEGSCLAIMFFLLLFYPLLRSTLTALIKLLLQDKLVNFRPMKTMHV